MSSDKPHALLRLQGCASALSSRSRPPAPLQIEVKDSGICELDFFVGRTTNPDFERRLCQRLKRAIERPIEVTVTGKGVDAVTTELCVTAPWDAGGHARPRVLLDVTHALRQLGIMVFKARALWRAANLSFSRFVVSEHLSPRSCIVR